MCVKTFFFQHRVITLFLLCILDAGNFPHIRRVLLHCYKVDSTFRNVHNLQRFVNENLEVRILITMKLNFVIQTS